MRRFVLLLVLVTACGVDDGRSAAAAQTLAGDDAHPRITLVQLASGLDLPVGLAHAGDGSSRLFVLLQRGRIVILQGTSILPEPFLDIRPLVSCCGERGLLGLAFHPQYATNGFFFINYTDVNGDTVVARYSRSAADPARAESGSAQVVLRIPQPFSNHNGGQLAFGPDGYLHIGTGDGGSGGDPGNRAQDLSTLLGKILRIDVDRGEPYTLPQDNPFRAAVGARGEIWSYGLRNPWRFSFDRQTGDLFIADVGQNRLEEVNFTPASSGGGENYGWRIMEGSQCFNPATGCSMQGLVLPVLEYGRSQGCSVTGGYRYRGARFPSLRGLYFYGDYCSGRIWGASQNAGGQWNSTELLDTTYSITSFGEDQAGEIYVVDHGGRILLISGDPVRSRPARATR
jgi:glucose/arabinose dehydrogenase